MSNRVDIEAQLMLILVSYQIVVVLGLVLYS